MRCVFAIAVLLVTASAAGAEPDLDKLGFRVAFSRAPLADGPLAVMQLGLGVEHRFLGKARILAEYEWLWLRPIAEPSQMEVEAPMTSGHRAHLGLRRAIASKDLRRLRLFVDVEGGGGLGIYDTARGTRTVPHGFAGVRLGYQLFMRRSRAASALETAFHFRALAFEHGVGFGAGFDFYWGD